MEGCLGYYITLHVEAVMFAVMLSADMKTLLGDQYTFHVLWNLKDVFGKTLIRLLRGLILLQYLNDYYDARTSSRLA